MSVLNKNLITAVVVGHVDHGKSTILGRLLMECGLVTEERLALVKSTCEARSICFEPAFLFDALKEEQEQGISIDTTRVSFDFGSRKFILIDAPGHLEFIKNMMTGASEASIGIVIVDCNQGIRAQTERHLKILSLLQIKQAIVVCNKIDLIEYDEQTFHDIANQCRELVSDNGIGCYAVVPVSALQGENISKSSPLLKWYQKSLLETLIECGDLENKKIDQSEQPLRMVLQDVYKFGDKRLFAGRVISGILKPGAEILFSPTGKISAVESIERYPDRQVSSATSGDSVALTLTEQVFVERGELITEVDHPPEIDNEIHTNLVWLANSDEDFDAQNLIFKIGTKQCRCRAIDLKEDWQNQQHSLAGAEDGKSLFRNGAFFKALIKTEVPVAFDARIEGLNRFVLCNDLQTLAAGTILSTPNRKSHYPPRARGLSNPDVEGLRENRREMEVRGGHKSTVLWLTGLSGAGKSTLARALEASLKNRGLTVAVLDADALRTGLNSDLGFSRSDRAENVRRIAHLARILVDHGLITIVACISPYSEDRETARNVIGASDFQEIYLYCPIEECIRRDAKGLYLSLDRGEIADLTGRDAPYQPPAQPALRLDSSKLSIAAEVSSIEALLDGLQPEAHGARKVILATAAEYLSPLNSVS